MTNYELTDNAAVTISFSVPLSLKKQFLERVPKRRSEYLRNLLSKELGIQ